MEAPRGATREQHGHAIPLACGRGVGFASVARVRSQLASRVAFAVLALALAAMARAEATRDDPVPPSIADRLGRPVPLGKLRGSLGPVARDLARLLRGAFGVDASRVPVYVLDKKGLLQVDAVLSGRAARHDRLRGLEYRGVVYLDGQHIEVRETLTHELLHALSRRFSGEANRFGHHALVEGMTQYMTRQTGVTGELRAAGVRRRGTAYGMYLRFAERLADVLGDQVIARCYFRGGFVELEREADRALGKGRLARALERLKQDDLGAALRALGAEAGSPFDGVFAD